MIKVNQTEEKICEYYDGQMTENELFRYESRIAISKNTRDYVYQKCYEYFKISNSINLTKHRAQKNSQMMFEKFEKEYMSVNINSVVLKRINKLFSNFFLNILRNDS